MPTQCCMMWFKPHSSVLGKAVVKGYYLELCFKLWRILIWMSRFGTVIYMSLSCETFPQLLRPACKWAVWWNSTEVNGGPLSPLRMWLFNMLSDDMPLSFYFVYYPCKRRGFFPHGYNKKLHIFMSIWFVTDREKNLSHNLFRRKHEWISVLSVREKLGVKIILHQCLFSIS